MKWGETSIFAPFYINLSFSSLSYKPGLSRKKCKMLPLLQHSLIHSVLWVAGAFSPYTFLSRRVWRKTGNLSSTISISSSRVGEINNLGSPFFNTPSRILFSPSRMVRNVFAFSCIRLHLLVAVCRCLAPSKASAGSLLILSAMRYKASAISFVTYRV